MTGLAGRRWLAPLLLGVVVVVDHVLARMPFDLLLTGVLDESAHLATAALVLLAIGHLRGPLDRRFVVVVLVSACAIDVDHVPLVLELGDLSTSDGRPFTHSLATPLVLVLGWLGWLSLSKPRRWLSPSRWSSLSNLFLAAALGVLLHLFRDLASGPGVPAFWPLTGEDVRLPASFYLAVLVVVTFLATPGRERAAASAGPPGRS